ncbi:hypothetical protein NYE33_20710 [Paenibacillus sp. FSL R10-2199]|uniref:hypothetical protein n=1 Tax=Paenibacillus sp. FSL R10-2199 TaxID=2975348 RepID=UPI0030FAB99B
MTKKLKQIAIYGKGGIGKSTITSNISTALLGGRLQGHAIRLCSQKRFHQYAEGRIHTYSAGFIA